MCSNPSVVVAIIDQFVSKYQLLAQVLPSYTFFCCCLTRMHLCNPFCNCLLHCHNPHHVPKDNSSRLVCLSSDIWHVLFKPYTTRQWCQRASSYILKSFGFYISLKCFDAGIQQVLLISRCHIRNFVVHEPCLVLLAVCVLILSHAFLAQDQWPVRLPF